ncbi:hypothetical protein ES705_48829 [subsurface metagenome]
MLQICSIGTQFRDGWGGKKDVRKYFEHLPNLIQNYPYEVSLAYIFLQTEKAQNRTIYCGVVKIHRAQSTIASGIINSRHMTREGFLELYKNDA